LTVDFPTTLKCQKTFTSITIRSSSTITVPPGCLVHLKSHIIQHDTATTDSDLEIIHCEWSWDLNTLFPKYHTEAFKNTIIHLQNLTTISIDNFNKAVEIAMAKSKSDYKTVQDYLKDLDNIKNSETNMTSTNNIFIIALTLIAIQSCYCIFNIYSLHINQGHGPIGIVNANKEEHLKNWSL
jgi:hypothetical protein